ncbi:metal-sulfur cluster biosynthetic enzyme/ribosomal protein L22 [Nocardia transvalensis]|uniref:50S ribosomal protein L22 n=1 Tax=Nocardia transvalensis TaxID=37333 RepID=A0A7W9PIN8_9NOCA|nr:uL22 family ribosomal protein [Nocardia transvalensis]MBB5916615.1 metal-sulfur cluster biosynthetic enzyme/ribosomal protein L22 [Nocardia transvalensis]
MTTFTALKVEEPQVRVPHADAARAAAAVSGMTLPDALRQLRFAPGRACEPVARIVEKAIADARASGLEPGHLVVTEAVASPGEDIVRVRRKAHGKADWISSVTSDIVLHLAPRGLVDSETADPPQSSAPEPDETASRPASAVTADAIGEAVRERLYDVIDPDLGVNIVDLGFVRAVEVDAGVACITMTLTSPACPLTGVMTDQIRTELLGSGEAAPVSDFHIDWVWVPPWKPADISDDGREQLRAIGFTF